jgi:hypothetical protein
VRIISYFGGENEPKEPKEPNEPFLLSQMSLMVSRLGDTEQGLWIIMEG